MSNLHLVASLMDNFMRSENYAQGCLLGAQQRTIHDLLDQINNLTIQVRNLRNDLHQADGLIFETNLRNWDLVEQNELLRNANADLDYQLNGTAVSSPATTILEDSSDTESEDLFSTHDDVDM